MAQMIIRADNGEEITFIISPSDAFELMNRFINKYPNALKSHQTVQQFTERWTAENQEQAEGRFKR